MHKNTQTTHTNSSVTKDEEVNFIAPALSLNRGYVDDYWLALEKADTLRFRLCDLTKPRYKDVINMYRNKHLQCFMVFNVKQQKVVAEFMLENFMCLTAQVHFSMHPDNDFKTNIHLASWATDQVLDLWVRQSKKPFLDALYGLTPATNRVACIFVLKAGFKKIGYLHNAIKDRGKIVEAMIVEKRHGRIG